MVDKNRNKDFFKLLESVEFFSHAYLFETDSLKDAYPYVLMFAKKIICENHFIDNQLCGDCNICHLIDELAYDDYYFINPTTLSIKKEEIDRLFKEFSKQSIKKDGHRVYVIYGIERMSDDVSNKLLKFLEEPEKNIHALLMTENSNAVLPTIRSRCQSIKIKVQDIEIDEEIINHANSFLKGIIQKKEKMIGYTNEYVFRDYDTREKLSNLFIGIEKVLLKEINEFSNYNYKREFENISLEKLLKLVKLTDDLGKTITYNVNSNLLIDRYIIEAKDVLTDEKNCRNNI